MEKGQWYKERKVCILCNKRRYTTNMNPHVIASLTKNGIMVKTEIKWICKNCNK